MRMVDLIEKKRDGLALSTEEISFMINGFTEGVIPDYQMSAMAMAIFFQDMNDKERADLTKAVLYSGETIDLKEIKGIKVDKHSTGGVGDKTTLVIAPIVASCGVPVAKMSGRGLGHTGGTLDKLESIPGFDIFLERDEFFQQVNTKHIAVIGQTANLTPADKLLYALRDVTGTVPSVPLIASSIMSKKLASGANAIVLDVKTGSGSFNKTIEQARELAGAMVRIGKEMNRDTSALITNMDQPLGYAIGNSLEVIEAIETLKGNGPVDFTELCINLAAHMVFHAKAVKTKEEAIQLVKSKLASGEALEKLRVLIESQGGNGNVIDDYSIFDQAKEVIEVCTKEAGYIKEMTALPFGVAAMLLGAGRETKDQDVDHSVGVVLTKKVGDMVKKGECFAKVYTNGKNTQKAINMLLENIIISKEYVAPLKLILEVIE